MLRVLLKVQISCPWVKFFRDNTADFKSAVTILQCKPRYNGNGVSAMVRIHAPSWNSLSLSRFIQRVNGVKEASFTEIKPGIFVGLVKTTACPCSKTPLPYLNLLNVSSSDDGYLYWTILVNDNKELNDILNSLEKQGVRCTLCSVEKVREAWSISARQAMLLEEALKAGFYDNPRRVTLKELADNFNISPRAVSEILRRAHKKIIHQTLEIGYIGAEEKGRKKTNL